MKPNSRRGEPTAPVSATGAAQAQAIFKEGLALHHQGRLAQAQQSYHQVVTLQPQHFEAWHLLGVIAAQSRQYAQAIELIGRSIAINPENAAAHANLGNALKDLGQYQDAIESYDNALALKPDYANAYGNRGMAQYALKQYQAAIHSCDKAIAIQPGMALAHYQRGNALCALRQYQGAVQSYDNAIELQPDHGDAWSNRGVALHFLRQYQAALHSYDKAISIKADSAQAYYNRGITLNDLKQHQAAVGSYDSALAINPNLAQAWANRGNALNDLKQHEAAVDSYDKAMALDADAWFLPGMRLYTRMQLCDWRDAEVQTAALVQKIQGGASVAPPFSVLALSASLPLQRQAAESYVNERYPANPVLGIIPKRPRGKKIRLGYFSADFHNHATAYLMAELFERHDKTSFELVAFSYGTDSKDEMRRRVSAAFDQFIDVRLQSDPAVAQLSRSLGIDIAIDLKGFTEDERVGIFACRAAPLQVSYLGYPGTMGARYFDYVIADRMVIREEDRQHYTEKIAYLPNSYQVNDRRRKIADRQFTRNELGLPETGFVFCCFNSNHKITPATFDGWMRILKRVEDSVLWLLADNPTARSNLRQQAQLRGVDPQRLVFAQRLPLPEHLARHRAADLFIDTLPYNAHTTASDALWSGLPVLTCSGESFASRVAASLLTATDLPELITATQADYEALAVQLAREPERLRAIRQKLQHNRLATPLFDTQLFTRHIEDAYAQMFERYQADLGPEHIEVGQ